MQICVKRMNLWQRKLGSSGVHDKSYGSTSFSPLFCWARGAVDVISARRKESALEQLFKLSWLIARDLVLACQALLDVLVVERRHDIYASRSFFPLNYVTVKTTFWRSQPTTWIPPIKVTLNKNKAIRHNTLVWYNCYSRLYVYGAM